MNTSTLTISKGEDIVVSCSAIGTPTFIDYAWTKDGNTVENNSLLVVRNANVQDGGMYTCHARNSVGEKTVKVVVTVKCKLKLDYMSTLLYKGIYRLLNFLLNIVNLTIFISQSSTPFFF